jgi:hypothetical protein
MFVGDILSLNAFCAASKVSMPNVASVAPAAGSRPNAILRPSRDAVWQPVQPVAGAALSIGSVRVLPSSRSSTCSPPVCPWT